jgi:hypothetical protein
MGVIPGKRFSTNGILSEEIGPEAVDWRLLNRRELQPKLTGYNLQIIFVEGELGSIIDLFVRINSTGRALTSQEKRHSRYHKSEFFKKAAKLAESEARRFTLNRVLSANQISRMNLKTAVDSRRARQALDPLRFPTAAHFTKWVTTAVAPNTYG